MNGSEKGGLSSANLTIGEVYADLIGVGDNPQPAAVRDFWDSLPQNTAEAYRTLAPQMRILYEDAQRPQLAPANRKLLAELLGQGDIILATCFMLKAQEAFSATVKRYQRPGHFPYHEAASVLGKYWYDAAAELYAAGHYRSGLCPDSRAGQQAAFLVAASYWIQNDQPEATADSLREELQQLFNAVQFHAYWGSTGGARIFLRTHELAAALMMSEYAEGIKVHIPFPMFELVLPDGLLAAPTDSGGTTPLTKVWVISPEDTNPELQDTVFVVPYAKGKFTSFDARFARNSTQSYLRALYNLISGVCLSMSDAEFPPDRVGKGHKAKKEANRDVFGNTLVRSWRIGRPVDTGYRRILKEFLVEGKGAPKVVQWWRRGSWVHQPYGTRSALRRLQWRRPALCGSRNGPLLVRPYIAGKKDDQ